MVLFGGEQANKRRLIAPLLSMVCSERNVPSGRQQHPTEEAFAETNTNRKDGTGLPHHGLDDNNDDVEVDGTEHHKSADTDQQRGQKEGNCGCYTEPATQPRRHTMHLTAKPNGE